MAKQILRAPKRRIELSPILDRLGEAPCVVECVIDSLESTDHGTAGPAMPALHCALRGLNDVHLQLSELENNNGRR
jgi:hypothetical protein